jgi:hypothetical protein
VAADRNCHSVLNACQPGWALVLGKHTLTFCVLCACLARSLCAVTHRLLAQMLAPTAAVTSNYVLHGVATAKCCLSCTRCSHIHRYHTLLSVTPLPRGMSWGQRLPLTAVGPSLLAASPTFWCLRTDDGITSWESRLAQSPAAYSHRRNT